MTSLTPLLDVLGAAFGFGSATAGVLGMLPTASFALFGVTTPMVARRIGLERTALLAMSLAFIAAPRVVWFGDVALSGSSPGWQVRTSKRTASVPSRGRA